MSPSAENNPDCAVHSYALFGVEAPWSSQRFRRQESGRLDSRRLATLLTPGAKPRLLREEQASTVQETCVTLLVVQSGSMRGRPQQMAVQTIDLAIQTLEPCRITCEVLGYTTSEGEDNPASRA